VPPGPDLRKPALLAQQPAERRQIVITCQNNMDSEIARVMLPAEKYWASAPSIPRDRHPGDCCCRFQPGAKLQITFVVAVFVVTHEHEIDESKNADRNRCKKRDVDEAAHPDAKNKKDNPHPPGFVPDCFKTFHDRSKWSDIND
jgi:hypothetical protein